MLLLPVRFYACVYNLVFQDSAFTLNKIRSTPDGSMQPSMNDIDKHPEQWITPPTLEVSRKSLRTPQGLGDSTGD